MYNSERTSYVSTKLLATCRQKHLLATLEEVSVAGTLHSGCLLLTVTQHSITVLQFEPSNNGVMTRTPSHDHYKWQCIPSIRRYRRSDIRISGYASIPRRYLSFRITCTEWQYQWRLVKTGVSKSCSPSFDIINESNDPFHDFTHLVTSHRPIFYLNFNRSFNIFD